MITKENFQEFKDRMVISINGCRDLTDLQKVLFSISSNLQKQIERYENESKE